MTDTLIQAAEAHDEWARAQLGRETTFDFGKADAIADLREFGYEFANALNNQLALEFDDHDYAQGYHVGTSNAGLGVGHVWTEVKCPAYLTQRGLDCTCGGAE